MKPKSAKEKKDWIVRMNCAVTKEVTCSNCTEEEARSDPYAHSDSEREIEQTDYKVTRVEPQ